MRKLFFLFAVLGLAPVLPAEELRCNATFQLGCGDVQITRFLRPDTNPKQIFDPLKIEVVDGVNALRIDNRFCERIEINAPEIPLKQGTEYKFTLKLKSSAPVRIALTNTGNHPVLRWDSKSRTVPVGNQFKTYSFTHKTKDKPIGFYTPQIKFDCDRPTTLYIAEWSIRKVGDNTPDKVQIAAVTERSYYVQGKDAGRTVPVKVSAYNPTSGTVKFNLTLYGEETASGCWTDQKYTPVSSVDGGSWEIPAGQTLSRTFSLPTPRYAYYRVRIETKNLKTLNFGSKFSVLGPYKREKLDLDRDFCVGFNGGTGYSRPPDSRYPKPSVMALGMSPDDMLECFAAQGIRLFRTWGYPGSFSWFILEPEQGKLNRQALDHIIDQPLRHGIYTLAVIGSDFGTIDNFKRRWPHGLPDWLIPRCKKELAWRQKDFSKNALFKPSEKDWKNYVRQIVRYAGKRITHYEIMNEPHLTFSRPADYVPYLKWAYEVIKAENPDAKVVGFCATSDLGARMEAFYVPCFRAGGLKYADIVSFHPYQNPKLSSPQPADETVRQIRRMIRRFSGNKYPLWNTELYYLRGDTGLESLKRFASAYDLTQRMLTDLGEGLAQSISLEWSQFQNSSSPHFLSSNGITGRLTPNSFGVTCNMFARYLEGAKPAGKLAWANDSICYLYRRRNGSFAAAFWHYGAMTGLKVDLNCKAKNAVLLDLFGNEMPIQKSAALDENPKVLLWKGSLKELEKAMKSVNIHAECPVVATPEARLLPAAGGKYLLSVNLRNVTGKKVKLRIGTAAAAAAVDAELEPFQARSVQIMLTRAVSGTVKLRIFANGQMVSLPVNVAPCGKVAHCGGPHQAKAILRGKKALPNSWRITRKNGNLKIVVNVADTTPSGEPNGRPAWEQDCVELFFDAMPEETFVKHSSGYNSNVFRLFLMPDMGNAFRMEAQPANCAAGKEAKISSRRDANGYEITLVLPEKAIFGKTAPAGKLLGFEIKIDDTSATGPVTGEYSWNGEKTPFADRYQFGTVIL